MSSSIHGRIKNIIEETNYAFSYCRGSLNIDYAEFAAMSLFDFKSALHNPNLTGPELMSILRDAAAQYKNTDPNGCWASFIAQYIERSSNGLGTH
ncbi:MAG: hypothetical protein AAF182_02605 [Pseudomonadota bacterium]